MSRGSGMVRTIKSSGDSVLEVSGVRRESSCCFAFVELR